MNQKELRQLNREWSERALSLLRDNLALMKPFAQSADIGRKDLSEISALLTASARSSESVLLLCSYGQVWDAEIVLRSVMEGTIKFSYLLATKDGFERRINEYSDELFDIAIFKDHGKAKEYINAFPNASRYQRKPIEDLLLSRKEHERISNRFSSKERRSLEMRWGFVSMVKELAELSSIDYSKLPALLHSYSIASHIQHVDSVGAWLPFDRENRGEERRDSMHLAHLARLISDVLSLFFIRLMVSHKFIDEDWSKIIEAWDECRNELTFLDSAYYEWFSNEYHERE